MKRSIILSLMAFCTMTMYSQEFQAGLSTGIPLGDASDIYTWNFSLDLTVLWEVSEPFEVGATTGLSYNLGDEFDLGEPFGTVQLDDGIYLPIAAAARYEITEKLELGADLGYAIAVSPSNYEGGFYYVARTHYDLSDSLDLFLAYRGISGDLHFLTLGLEYEF